MKIEQQVTSLEISKRLKELGVKQESHFEWECNGAIQGNMYDTIVHISNPDAYDVNCEYISAFTCSELGEMLPAHLQIDKYQSSKYLWSVYYSDMQMRGVSHKENADTLADAMGKMLIYLEEHKKQV